jgi:hypothetical protein
MKNLLANILKFGAKMRKLIILITLCLMTGHLYAADSGLVDRLFRLDDVNQEIAASGLSSGGSPVLNATMPDNISNPGKVLLLSAIIPGAGQYSIGSKWRALLFFGIEVAAWTGVVTYYNQGQDKDKEFKIFADDHFTETIYREHEYSLAINSVYGNEGAYKGDLPTWTDEEWDDKLKYLPSGGFTHELPTSHDRATNSSDDQQYYEMIGKYIRQFGIGWDKHEDDFGFDPNDPSTPHWDGTRTYSLIYMDMRYDSNQLLDKSSLAIQLAMLNHVASALDASFTVRALRRQARAEVGFRPIRYNDDLLAVGGLNFTW